MYLEDLNEDIKKVLLKTIESDKITKFLAYSQYDVLSQPTVPNPSGLLYTKIFPFRYIPDTLEEENAYLTISFGKIKPTVSNPRFKVNVVTFYAICHKNLVITKQGLRYFCILNEIENMF
jgi:hypothetical protein